MYFLYDAPLLKDIKFCLNIENFLRMLLVMLLKSLFISLFHMTAHKHIVQCLTIHHITYSIYKCICILFRW
jgi:hypothetical protein